jgi:hypothetical protein
MEMIDDDGGAFRDQARAPANIATAGGSRWIGPAAAVALVAIVGYSVISSAIQPDDATTPTTPTTPNLIEPQYYVADPPSGFKMYLAEQRGESDTTAGDFSESAPAQLWGTVDASATSGSWFVVSLGHNHASGRSSYRTLVDGNEVIVEHDPASGLSRLSFTKDGQALEIDSRGWVDRQLLRLVRSVGVDPSGIRFSDHFFATDHTRILDVDPATALFGAPVARVGYATGMPPSLAENFSITVSADDLIDRATVANFAITRRTHSPIGDLTAIVGQSVEDPAVSIVQWRDGRRLITMSGNLNVSQMQGIAATVHTSPDDTVRRQLETPVTSSALGAAPHTVASGTLSDGAWTIQVSTRDPDKPDAGYLWWIGQPGDSAIPSETRPSLPSGAPTIETLVEHGRTYVLAKVPRGMTGAELHVSPTGKPSTVTPLFDVDPSLADQFTAAVFLEPVPFTARIVDSNGTTVVAWP